MRVSEITLPPLVAPPKRGALVLSLGAVSWSEAAPTQLKNEREGVLQARVIWWGDASGGEAVPLPAPGSAAACLVFPLHSGPRYMTRYFKDMGCLTITVEALDMLPSHTADSCSNGSTPGQPATARALAVASVRIMALDVQAPVSGSFPLVLPPDQGAGEAAETAATIVGSLPVSLELDYESSDSGAPLLSSFELNEHLAGAADAAVQAAEDSVAAAGHADSQEPARLLTGVPSTCGKLATVLSDSELTSAALQQLAARPQAEGAGGDEPLVQSAGLCQLLALLLPDVSRQHWDYAAAMLLPWQHSTSAGVLMGDLAAAAAACAAVEQRLQQQPTSDALRCLRQLAAALGSRSLDLAAAFGSVEGQRLEITELGSLLRRLHPTVSTEEARCLLALLAAQPVGNGTCADGITLPALKAALATVQEAQQFPTPEDLERQHTAVAVRRAKEAAATAGIAGQRAEVAAAAALSLVQPQQQPRLDRKQSVRRLKSSSLQHRRRSNRGSSQQQEAHGIKAEPQQAAASGEQEQSGGHKKQAQAGPAVVVGIPVLLPPPPALPGAPPAAALPVLPASGAAACSAQPSAPAPVPAAARQLPEGTSAVSSEPATPHPERPPQPQQHAPAQPSSAQLEPQHDPLLLLIQQAEQLKASLEQAGSRGGNRLASLASGAAGPRLPNLLLPGPALTSAPDSAGGSALMTAVADGSLSAATAALVAAAKALREEADQLPLPTALPAVQSASTVQPPGMPASAVAATLPASRAAAAQAAAPAGFVADSTAAAQAAAPAAPEADSAAAPQLVPAWDLSDPESDAEDALLESLFFSQRPQAGAAAPAAAPPPPAPAPGVPLQLGTDHVSDQQTQQQLQQQQFEVLLRVQLGSLELEKGMDARAGVGGSVRCVVKPLHKAGQAQQLTLPVGCGPAHACQMDLPLPAAVASLQHSHPMLPPYLFLEFWQHSGSLLGMARVPLLQPPGLPGAALAVGSAEQAGAPALPAAVVAEGRQVVCNILDPQAQQAGSIYVAAVLQGRLNPPRVAAVQHRFNVRIRSAHRLPSAAAYAAAGLRAPDGLVLRYSFPGEAEALPTQEVPCCSNPSFEASASHEMTVPATQPITPLLQDGLLRFEVFDCWADRQAQQLHGWAVLPLCDLASLVADAQRGGSDSGSFCGAREASKTLLLPLCTEYDLEAEAAGAASAAAASGAAPSRAPSLEVQLSYCAQLCTMDAAEAAAESTTAAGAALQSTQAEQEMVRQQQGGQQSQSCSNGASGGSDSESGDENSRRAANRSSADGLSRRRHQQLPQQLAGRPREQPAASPAEPAAAPAQALPAQLQEPEEPSVPAGVSVEIVRACGLAAAVRAAAAACGADGASVATSLDRAAAVGPHAFARLLLFPADPSLQAQAPAVQTPFVAQCFAPAWHAAHSYQLRLTSSMLEALATQSLRVEVWHRCPRAAATRSAGGIDGSGQREVLLGVGSAPLLDVLRNRQGLRCWVNLANGGGSGSSGSSGSGSSGSVLGAVQITVRLSELAGVPLGSCGSGERPQDEPPLLLCPQAAALVPPALRGALLLPPGSGFSGQLAVLALHVDQLAPATCSRPKADRHFCSYRLPWGPPANSCSADGSGSASSSTITTASRVLTAVGGCSAGGAGAGVVAFGSRRGSGTGGVKAGARAPPLQQWVANMRHSGFFEVPAGPELVEALLSGPPQLSVFKLPASASSTLAAPGPARTAVLVGTAEVDLSPLLWPGREGADDAQRSLEGVFPLLSSTASRQGCATLSVRAQLQLAPAAPAAQQAAAAAQDGRDAASVAWQAELAGLPQSGPTGYDASPQAVLQVQPQQEEQQSEAQPSACLSSSDDNEELLQRCRWLLKPAVGSAQFEQPAHSTAGNGSSSSSSSSTSPEAVCSTLQHQHQRQDQGGSPAGAGQPEQQVPAAGAASGQSAPVEGSSSQQDQQLAAAQGVASPAEVAGLQDQQGASPAVQQQEQRGNADPAGKLLVKVETALRLPALLPALAGGAPAAVSNSGGASYAASVQVTWQPEQADEQQQQHVSACTEAVAVHAVEAANLGGTAVWQQELQLSPVAAAAWLGWVHGSGGGGLSGGPTLLVNVWAAGAEASSASGAATPSVLVGCATVDLSSLLWQPELCGWFQLISSSQQRSGQLKLTARPDAALQRQLAAFLPDAAAAMPGSARAAADQGAAAEGAADLQQQLAAQLQELELLSQRLAAGPGQQEAAAQLGQQPGRGNASALNASAGTAGLEADAMLLRDLPGSDDELETAPFDARQSGFAWSGSDSEDDDEALLGVAIEGAVSPGFSDVDAEEEAQRRARGPRQPALLVDQDWMFDISRPSAPQERDPGAAEGTASAPATSGAIAPPEECPAAPRRPVRFRNVLPSTFLQGSLYQPPGMVSSSAIEPRLSGQQLQQPAQPAQHGQQQEEPAQRRQEQPTTSTPPPPAPARLLDQWGEPAAQPAAAAAVGGLLQQGWQFDIRVARAPPLPGPSPGTNGQFAPMQPQQPGPGLADLVTQRQQLAEQTQRVRGGGATAATIDEVIESLRPARRPDNGSGSAAPRGHS